MDVNNSTPANQQQSEPLDLNAMKGLDRRCPESRRSTVLTERGFFYKSEITGITKDGRWKVSKDSTPITRRAASTLLGIDSVNTEDSDLVCPDTN